MIILRQKIFLKVEKDAMRKILFKTRNLTKLGDITMNPKTAARFNRFARDRVRLKHAMNNLKGSEYLRNNYSASEANIKTYMEQKKREALEGIDKKNMRKFLNEIGATNVKDKDIDRIVNKYTNADAIERLKRMKNNGHFDKNKLNHRFGHLKGKLEAKDITYTNSNNRYEKAITDCNRYTRELNKLDEGGKLKNKLIKDAKKRGEKVYHSNKGSSATTYSDGHSMINLQSGKSSAATMSHEYGHAKDSGEIMRKGSKASEIYLRNRNNGDKVAILAAENAASAHGLSILKKAGASKEQLATAEKELKSAFNTYTEDSLRKLQRRDDTKLRQLIRSGRLKHSTAWIRENSPFRGI